MPVMQHLRIKSMAEASRLEVEVADGKMMVCGVHVVDRR